jgi:SAM-dependent methyltransferase/methyltransferase-like protein
MSTDAATSYDLIPYPSYTFPETHPDRMAVLATLLGLPAAPVARCRVLEIGCAAGANLIPMAEDLPGSTFVGIDLSRRQIDQGRQAVADLGLGNIELRHQGILEFEPGAETFDYILCHGVYSWVAPEVQERILAICRHSLHPDGVVYISYNTLPGWHMRGMIRDMMLYHGRRFSDPRQQVAEARGLLDFLVSSVSMEQNPYGQFLRSELEQLRRADDAYLFHDHLEEHNSPVYFHQFVERAAGHGLRYLADVDLCTMEFRNLPPQVGQVLGRVSGDLIQLEQYMDFLRNRTFRRSTLCRAHHTPRYRLEPAALVPLFIGSALQPSSPRPDLGPSVREDFRGPTGSSAFSIHPVVKAALLVLGEAWPQVLSFAELCARARARLGGEAATVEDAQQVGQALLTFYTIAADLVEFRPRPLRVAARPGPRPLARPLARWQAGTGRSVINLRHEFVAVDDFGRQVLRRLDGQHTRQAVAQELAAPEQGLDQQIEQFARRSLLVG